jgi:hypothetical protein
MNGAHLIRLDRFDEGDVERILQSLIASVPMHPPV